MVKSTTTAPKNLTSALKGHDALVIIITTSAVDPQKHMFDAAIAVGVKCIIPSEFGCDLRVEKLRSMPVYTAQVEAQEYLETSARAQERRKSSTIFL